MHPSHTSRRYRRLIQPSTVWLPAIRSDIRAAAAGVRTWFRRPPIQPRMRSKTIVVPLEIEQLLLQISSRPEGGSVQTLATNGADQLFDEWMRTRHVRHGPDVLHVEYSQIRLPLAKLIQRIMVRAEVRRRGLASRRSIEHPAQPHAINDASVHVKAAAPARAVVHQDQNPVRSQYRRFAAKQIKTPHTVLRVTEEREPGRPSRVWFGLVPHEERTQAGNKAISEAELGVTVSENA